MDILGKALLDFHQGNYTEDIKTVSSLNEVDDLPLPYLFREFSNMPKIEQRALELCRGKILDIGCGAGSHSLYLQQKGFEIVALDQSVGAIEICQKRGLKNTVNSEILSYCEHGYDTLLLLMNGIGLATSLKKLPSFLNHLKGFLTPNGQILLDSSDIIYMFEDDEDGGFWVPGDRAYYGEVQFQMSYKNEKGPVFDWLYIDFNTLSRYAEKQDLNCEMIVEGEHYDYLARLTLK